MRKSSIVILSGACCNPSLKTMDIQIEKVLMDSAQVLGIEAAVKVVSIASTAFGGFGGFGEKLKLSITALLKEKGLGILPLVIIDGEIKHYASIPTFEEACQYFRQSV